MFTSPPKKKKLKQITITDLLKKQQPSVNSRNTSVARLQQKRIALKKFQTKTSTADACTVPENKCQESSEMSQDSSDNLLVADNAISSVELHETASVDESLNSNASCVGNPAVPDEKNSFDWFDCEDQSGIRDKTIHESNATSSNQIHSESSNTESTADGTGNTPSDKICDPTVKWLGIPYNDLSRTYPSLGVLQSSTDHHVLFKGRFNGVFPPEPFDHPYSDRWDAHHVRLPSSPKNQYPVDTPSEKRLKHRWEIIESCLLMNLNSSIDIEESILVYNTRYSNQWSFRSLHTFFTDFVDTDFRKKFFETTLPKMVELALQIPTLFPKPIPLLRQHYNCRVTMTQQQVACLLCNAFFCTYPRRNSRHKDAEYANFPLINFNSILQGGSRREEANLQKIRTLLHYFERVTDNMPTGTITYERRVINKGFPLWNQSPCTLGKLHIRCDGMIEDAEGLLQMDFANKFIGGGVLHTGLVQEEIRFCICPELIASMLFMEKMNDNECIIITGAERYSQYSGYAETYKWIGNYEDTTNRDNWGRRKTQILAVDATRHRRSSDQYAAGSLKRELNKAYCGFCLEDPDCASAVATGNWGCGAFGGNPILKSLIQLMAAAAAGREMCYFTFEDKKLMHEIYDLYSYIINKSLTISDLWCTIFNYHREIVQNTKKKLSSNETLASYLKRRHAEYDQSTDESL